MSLHIIRTHPFHTIHSINVLHIIASFNKSHYLIILKTIAVVSLRIILSRGGVYKGAVHLEELNMLLSQSCPDYGEKRLQTERAERVRQAKGALGIHESNIYGYLKVVLFVDSLLLCLVVSAASLTITC